jgi:hypothetical protein
MLFLVNCGGGDSSDDSSNGSSQENSVTIAGTTIPLSLGMEDEIFSQKVLEWNDGNADTFMLTNFNNSTQTLGGGISQRPK